MNTAAGRKTLVLSGRELGLLKYYLSRSVLNVNGSVYNPVAEEADCGNELAMSAMELRAEILANE